MKVNALDHVNIVTADLEGTAAFYQELLGLERRDGPPPLTPQTCQWMHDASGRAVVHINSVDCPRFYDRDTITGPTGAVHHIALNCSGHAEMLGRLKARGLEHQINDVPSIGLRQIFTMDPNGVLLELNFLGD